jgi:hypothetical protein
MVLSTTSMLSKIRKYSLATHDWLGYQSDSGLNVRVSPIVPHGMGLERRLRFSLAFAWQWRSVSAHSFFTRDAQRPSANSFLHHKRLDSDDTAGHARCEADHVRPLPTDVVHACHLHTERSKRACCWARARGAPQLQLQLPQEGARALALHVQPQTALGGAGTAAQPPAERLLEARRDAAVLGRRLRHLSRDGHDY